MKKTVRRNIYGNLVGYVGRQRFMEFGYWDSWHAQELAKEWLASK